MRILVTRNFDKLDPIGYLTLRDDVEIPPHSVFALGYLMQGEDKAVKVQEVSLVPVPYTKREANDNSSLCPDPSEFKRRYCPDSTFLDE